MSFLESISMNKLLNAFLNMNDLDDFAMGNSWLHCLHPLLKLLCSFVWIVFVLTTYHIIELGLYFIMILIISKSINLSFQKLMKRGLIGLPLSLCLGLSYILFNHRMIILFHFVISQGLYLCVIVFIKTFICLSIAYLLIVTTSFDALASELIYIKIPAIFVLQLTMTYRYIFVFLKEAQTLTKAYLLRSPYSRAIELKDMGSFIGHLLVGSMNQSLHIYDCMKCRGFDVKKTYTRHTSFELENIFLFMMMLSFIVFIRMVFI